MRDVSKHIDARIRTREEIGLRAVNRRAVECQTERIDDIWAEQMGIPKRKGLRQIVPSSDAGRQNVVRRQVIWRSLLECGEHVSAEDGIGRGGLVFQSSDG